MKHIFKHTIALILIAVVLLSSLVAFSVAWFAPPALAPAGGSIFSGYFAGGDGSAGTPYIITSPIHLYNLAWLQNTGRFNNKTDDAGNPIQFHFVLAENLNMSAYKLPPIGTSDFPFMGTFEGNNHVIEGLTVSNILAENEVEKRPPGVLELNDAEMTGMFGVVGIVEKENYGTTAKPSISNFVLKNPTVRACTSQALVGLIGGYVNGDLINIGVEGGTIVSGAANTGAMETDEPISHFALIGKLGPNVFWNGVTNSASYNAGGSIEVHSTDTRLQSAVDDMGETIQVPNSIPDRAYISESINISSEADISKVYRYETMIDAPSGSNYTTEFKVVDPYSAIEVNKVDDTGAIGNLYSMHYKLKGVFANGTTISSPKGISFGGQPTKPGSDGKIPDNWNEAEFANGTTIPIPNDCVWFKPINAGVCDITFFVSNMNSNGFRSIYKFKREPDPNNPGKDIITEWQEMVLVFNKNAFASTSLNNKSMVCYQYKIDQDDLGYEYAIGNSLTFPSNLKDKDKVPGDNAFFYFLALAGASNSGGGVASGTAGAPSIAEVNFIPTGYTGKVSEAGMHIITYNVAIENVADEAEVSFTRTGEITQDGSSYTISTEDAIKISATKNDYVVVKANTS